MQRKETIISTTNQREKAPFGQSQKASHGQNKSFMHRNSRSHEPEFKLIHSWGICLCVLVVGLEFGEFMDLGFRVIEERATG